MKCLWSGQYGFVTSSCWHRKALTVLGRNISIHRIARSPKSVLYSEFANRKQKCKCYGVGMEKKNVLPCPSTLSAQIFPL